MRPTAFAVIREIKTGIKRMVPAEDTLPIGWEIVVRDYNSLKCECGGDKSKTTHSYYCPKYMPYKPISKIKKKR